MVVLVVVVVVKVVIEVVVEVVVVLNVIVNAALLVLLVTFDNNDGGVVLFEFKFKCCLVMASVTVIVLILGSLITVTASLDAIRLKLKTNNMVKNAKRSATDSFLKSIFSCGLK